MRMTYQHNIDDISLVVNHRVSDGFKIFVRIIGGKERSEERHQN